MLEFYRMNKTQFMQKKDVWKCAIFTWLCWCFGRSWHKSNNPCPCRIKVHISQIGASSEPENRAFQVLMIHQVGKCMISTWGFALFMKSGECSQADDSLPSYPCIIRKDTSRKAVPCFDVTLCQVELFHWKNSPALQITDKSAKLTSLCSPCSLPSNNLNSVSLASLLLQ